VPDLRRQDLRRRVVEANLCKFAAMQQKNLLLTMASFICVMLHCNIKMVVWQSPHESKPVQKLQTNP